MNFLIFVILGSCFACNLLIQKVHPDSYLIQSECKITNIMNLDTENNVDFTYLSENQIILSKINEANEYQFKFHKERKQKHKIIPNTNELQTTQEKVNELGIQSRYDIVLDNLLYDIAAAFIKGFLLLLI